MSERIVFEDELCEATEITTWGDVKRQYLCIHCGLSAIERPPKVCLTKGGRQTEWGCTANPST